MSNGTLPSARPKAGPLTIGIAGAGIGGLALAIALKRKGSDPVVFERRARHQVGEDGIFLTLAPNGFNALRGLGLADAVRAKGVVTTGIALHNEHGKRLGLIDYAAHAQAFGAPSVTIRRGALGEALVEAALAAGIDIRFGCAIDGLSEDGEGVTLAADGESIRFDMLVAADGLRSTVRRLALPHLPSPVFNGLIGSGGIVDVPGVAPTGGLMKMTFGRRAFFGYIKAEGGPVYWFDSYPAEADTGRVEDPAAYARFLQNLHRDDPLDNRTIISAERTIADAYADYDTPSLPQWFTNSVVLMGDAAHAVTPHSGQGASMALEDALVLAACIEAETSPIAAFRRFESLRRARVEAAVALGRQGGQQKKAQSWLSLRLRDLILPLVVPLGRKAQERLFAFRADQAPLSPPAL
jgi:2-polyprenyl-6-methoxyphenol hydroxylase-like FAD-dependent oxidoreductase